MRAFTAGDDILAAAADSLDCKARLVVDPQDFSAVAWTGVWCANMALDKRTFYLKDLTLIGCTAWDEPVFPDLISYLEHGEVRQLVAKTFPLGRIADAQREFLEKRHVDNFVLIPPLLEG